MYTREQIEAQYEKGLLKRRRDRDESGKGRLAGAKDALAGNSFGTSCKKLTLEYCYGYVWVYHRTVAWSQWIETQIQLGLRKKS